MSVSYKDFFESAERLLNNPNSSEIDFRNLISRSYYAAFHLSSEIAANLHTPVNEADYKKLGSHEKIIIQFERHSDKYLNKLAYLIRQRKLNRVRADYYTNLLIERPEAAQHFHSVKDLIAKLEKLKMAENTI
jgi:hypothetical protein